MGQIYGIMEFFSKDTRTPDEGLLTILKDIGKSIGEFIVHSKLVEQIKNISRLESLTGLLTRSALEDDLDKIIAEGGAQSIVVMVLNIDRFKLINESFGHQIGDHIIKSVAIRLKEPIGQENYSLAMLGADKFILYLYQEGKTNAFEYARTINNKFKVPFEFDKHKINLTASIGISIYPQPSESFSTNQFDSIRDAPFC